MEASIAALEEEFAAQKKLLGELKAQKEKEAQAKATAEVTLAKAKLAELDKIMADAAQQAAALKAQIAPTA